MNCLPSTMFKKWLYLIVLIIGSGSLYAQSSFFGLRKIDWTVTEVKEWSAKCSNQRWQGLLLYQGSDTACHHFISRVMDEWVWFKIKRNELILAEEKKYGQGTSAGPMGYYYVDPLKNFSKVKDY